MLLVVFPRWQRGRHAAGGSSRRTPVGALIAGDAATTAQQERIESGSTGAGRAPAPLLMVPARRSCPRPLLHRLGCHPFSILIVVALLNYLLFVFWGGSRGVHTGTGDGGGTWPKQLEEESGRRRGCPRLPTVGGPGVRRRGGHALVCLYVCVMATCRQ